MGKKGEILCDLQLVLLLHLTGGEFTVWSQLAAASHGSLTAIHDAFYLHLLWVSTQHIKCTLQVKFSEASQLTSFLVTSGSCQFCLVAF